MAVDSSPTLLILCALRIKGVAGDDALCAITGLAPATVGLCIAELSESGLVVRRTGRFAGLALTPPGRERFEGTLRAELSMVGRGDELRAIYSRFTPLNETFKLACTAWQVRDLDTQLLNDHKDAAYDAEVLQRLGQVHEMVTPIVGDLAGILSRFERYGVRLLDALQRVRTGDADAFTRPMSESYHDVWMELHEDLLLTLGMERDGG
jgi:hypothetical protein